MNKPYELKQLIPNLVVKQIVLYRRICIAHKILVSTEVDDNKWTFLPAGKLLSSIASDLFCTFLFTPHFRDSYASNLRKNEHWNIKIILRRTNVAGSPRQYFALVYCSTLPADNLVPPALLSRPKRKLTFPLCAHCLEAKNVLLVIMLQQRVAGHVFGAYPKLLRLLTKDM